MNCLQCWFCGWLQILVGLIRVLSFGFWNPNWEIQWELACLIKACKVIEDAVPEYPDTCLDCPDFDFCFSEVSEYDPNPVSECDTPDDDPFWDYDNEFSEEEERVGNDLSRYYDNLSINEEGN